MQSPAGTNAPEADLAEVEMHKATIDAANNASDPRANACLACLWLPNGILLLVRL